MWRVERRKIGVDAERKVGIVEWRRVIGRRELGTVREGRERRLGSIARGETVWGVTSRLRNVSDVMIHMKKPSFGVGELTVCGPCQVGPARGL